MTTIIGGSSPSITFSDSTTQTTAALPLTGGNLSGSIAFTASNAGITFNNSGALNNQLLNDYEYGNFTPSFQVSGATFTYAYQSGYYVKVGKMVTCFMAVSATSTSGASSNSNAVTMGNLPFATQSGSLYWIPASCGNWNSLNTNVMWVGGNCNNGTSINVYCTTAINTSVRQMTGNDIANAPFISMSITYPTAS